MTQRMLLEEFDPEITALKLGLRRAIKREKVPTALAPDLVARLHGDGLAAVWSDALVYASANSDGHSYEGADFTTVFISLHAADAQEAMALSIAEVGGAKTREQRAAVTDQIGELLGYPKCCRAAFARVSSGRHLAGGRAAIRLRALHASEGPPDPLLNDLSSRVRLISHVPCSYRCAASAALAAAVSAQLAEESPALAAEDGQLRSRPVLYWSADAYIALTGEWDRNRTLRYSAFEVLRRDTLGGELPVAGLDDVVSLLRQGDGLRPGLGTMNILTGDARVGRVEPLLRGDAVLLPWLFDWQGKWRAFERRPRVACVDREATTPDRRVDERLAGLAGDLLAAGLDAPLFAARSSQALALHLAAARLTGLASNADARPNRVQRLVTLLNRWSGRPGATDLTGPSDGACPVQATTPYDAVAAEPVGDEPAVQRRVKRDEPIEHLGELTAGTALTERWTVQGLRKRERGFAIDCTHIDGARVTFFAGKADDDAPSGPFDRPPWRVAYGQTDSLLAAFSEAGHAVASQLPD